MEWIEIISEDQPGWKWVRFYIDHLPFETWAPLEVSAQEVVDWRLAGLQEDYQEWGDYLHSHLAVEWPVEKEEEEGTWQ